MNCPDYFDELQFLTKYNFDEMLITLNPARQSWFYNITLFRTRMLCFATNVIRWRKIKISIISITTWKMVK